MSDIIANDHTPRLAVLEEIARGTKAVLDRIERRLDSIEATQRTQFLWLLVLTWATGITAALVIATLAIVVNLSFQVGHIAGELSVLIGHVSLK